MNILNRIEPYLMNIIIDLQNFYTWKTQLTIAVNFNSSEDAEEEFVMHSSSDNMKFTSNSDADEAINKLFKSICSKYQENLLILQSK